MLLIGAVAGYFFFLRPSDEEKIREVVTDYGAKRGNPEICDLVTQRFLEEVSGEKGDAAVEACRADVEAQVREPVEIEITRVDIDDDRATVEAEARGNSGTFELVNEDGVWLIDDSS